MTGICAAVYVGVLIFVAPHVLMSAGEREAKPLTWFAVVGALLLWPVLLPFAVIVCICALFAKIPMMVSWLWRQVETEAEAISKKEGGDHETE